VSGPERALPEELAAFVLRHGLARDPQEAAATPLTGGVSSDIWRVDLPGRSVCVKRALPQLRVAATWFAPVSRNRLEWEWLELAGTIAPDAVPRAIAHDPELGLFAMEFLPAEAYPLWKRQLLDGHVDVATAARVAACWRCCTTRWRTARSSPAASIRATPFTRSGWSPTCSPPASAIPISLALCRGSCSALPPDASPSCTVT
jgi:hypothetical protein